MKEVCLSRESISRNRFLNDFTTLERAINKVDQAPIYQLRRSAFERFKEFGFPNTKDENWKYTNISSLKETEFNSIPNPGAIKDCHTVMNTYMIPKLGGANLVFINGMYQAELSCGLETLPDGVKIVTISELLTREENDPDRHCFESRIGNLADFNELPFVALNTAFVSDGVFIIIPKEVEVDIPIHIAHIVTEESKQTAVYPRLYLQAESHSSVSLIETFGSSVSSSYFCCGVSEIRLECNAQLRHVKFVLEGTHGYHISSTHVHQSRDSRYCFNVFSLGGQIVRNEMYPILSEEGIETHINGLTVAQGSQHIDNFSVIDHMKPHCISRESFKGVYGDKSRGVFTGTIIVREQAQKTNAFQSSANLLLSEDAQVDTRPQLKIWADDVKCSHGATVGQLDDEALFYLRSRGISETEAKMILVHAFVSEIIESLPKGAVKNYAASLVHNQLAA